MNELLKDAVSMGSVDEVIELLNKGVNPDQKYENGFRPLHIAASVNQKKCLSLLLDSGANIDSIDDNGNTPLHIACERGSEHCIRELILRGARADIKNYKKKSPRSLIRSKELANHFKAYQKQAKNRPIKQSRGKLPTVPSSTISITRSSRSNTLTSRNTKFSEDEVNIMQELLKREEDLVARERIVSSKEQQYEILKKELKNKKKELEILEKRLLEGEKKFRNDVEEHTVTKIKSALTIVKNSEIQVLNEIGKGAFSTVYKAKWRGTLVAMKKLIQSTDDQKYSDEDSTDLFYRELKFMSKLRHPNIITVMGCGIEKNNYFILMELCNNNFFKVIHEQKLPPTQMIKYAIDAATALCFMHSNKPPIVHRDIKSSNMMISPSKELKLIDFGYCTYKNEKDYVFNKHGLTEKANRGTPAYMAPECFLDEEFSVYSDVFSFGVVLWEIVTREIPWNSKTPEAVYAEVTTGSRLPIPERSAYPQLLHELIRECWLEQGNNRPTMKKVLSTLKIVLRKLKSKSSGE